MKEAGSDISKSGSRGDFNVVLRLGFFRFIVFYGESGEESSEEFV